MTLAAALLHAMLALPVCAGEARDPDRLSVIARSIEATGATPSEAIALVTIAQAESGLCAAIHAGRPGLGGALGPWQIERASNRVPPFAGLSIEATTHAAGEALWLWRHSYQCGRSFEARFRAYAGAPCGSHWAGASKRAGLYAWISWRVSL